MGLNSWIEYNRFRAVVVKKIKMLQINSNKPKYESTKLVKKLCKFRQITDAFSSGSFGGNFKHRTRPPSDMQLVL